MASKHLQRSKSDDLAEVVDAPPPYTLIAESGSSTVQGIVVKQLPHYHSLTKIRRRSHRCGPRLPRSKNCSQVYPPAQWRRFNKPAANLLGASKMWYPTQHCDSCCWESGWCSAFYCIGNRIAKAWSSSTISNARCVWFLRSKVGARVLSDRRRSCRTHGIYGEEPRSHPKHEESEGRRNYTKADDGPRNAGRMLEVLYRGWS